MYEKPCPILDGVIKYGEMGLFTKISEKMYPAKIFLFQFNAKMAIHNSKIIFFVYEMNIENLKSFTLIKMSNIGN